MRRYFLKGLAFALLAVMMVPMPAMAVVATTKPLVLTLKDAVLLSIRSNNNLEQAEIQRIADKFSLTDAEWQFQPHYSFIASGKYTNTVANNQHSYSSSVSATPGVSLENHYGTVFTVTSDNALDTNGVYNPGLELSIEQPLIRGFGKAVVEATLNNAKDNEIVSRLQFKGTAIQAVTTTITDYFSLVEDYQTLAVSKATLENYQRTVENDNAMIAAGRMAKSDIVQAKAQVASQRSVIEGNLNSINTATNTLLNDLGLPPNTPISLPKKFDFSKIKTQILGSTKLPSLASSNNTALTNNISYQTAIITIRTLERSLLQTKDDNRWKLNLTASETLGNGTGASPNSGLASLSNGANHAESVGLNLEIPIDNVNNQQAIIDQKVSLEKARLALKESKRSLLDSVQSDYNTVVSSYKSLMLSLNALQLQKETVYIAEQKQLAGRVSTFEVLSNQKDLETAQQTVVTNEIAYLNSIIALEQALGITLEPWHIKLKY